VTRRLTLTSVADVNMTSHVATVTIDSCTFSLPRRHYIVYYVADFVLFYVTPLVVACVLYALIGRTLLRRRVDGGTPQRSSSTMTRRDGSVVVGFVPRRTQRTQRLACYGTASGATSQTQASSSRQDTLVIVVLGESVPRLAGVATVVSTREHHGNHCGADSKVKVNYIHSP